MADLDEIGRWITTNESLLSGLAAMVALVGATLSVLAFGTSGWRRRRREERAPVVPAPASASTSARESIGEPGPAREPGHPVLAVLAFENLSSDPELQYLSDGISEDIIQRVSRSEGLRVVGRSSSFQLRGERKGEAAGLLGCSHVLDGSVRRAADRVRISAHLIEAASRTTLWSERYDRDLADLFALQDEIADQVAGALDEAFAPRAPSPIDPAAYALYLKASPRSYAPDELRSNLGLLEVATERAPAFAEAWGRLAYQRGLLHFYLPHAARPSDAAQIDAIAERAIALDPGNVDALAARVCIIPPFGRFIELDAAIERLRSAPGAGHGRHYVGYFLRTMGRVRESLEESERVHRLDPLDPMSANLVALARMAAGRVDDAIPVYADLVERIPEMSYPVSSLLRAHAFKGDWPAVDRLLALAEKRSLRELEDGLAFIRAKRDPTPDQLARWRTDLEARVARTGCVDVSRLVYTAHLGLVDLAYALVGSARLGPNGSPDDVLGPDAYRASLLFQAGMPELRRDPRFVALCARLGLVELWLATEKWPDCADEVPYDFRAACEQARGIEKEVCGVVA
ncbi:MAG: hypothetical protein R3F35_14950 [Myxococcota bacterium]